MANSESLFLETKLTPRGAFQASNAKFNLKVFGKEVPRLFVFVESLLAAVSQIKNQDWYELKIETRSRKIIESCYGSQVYSYIKLFCVVIVANMKGALP